MKPLRYLLHTLIVIAVLQGCEKAPDEHRHSQNPSPNTLTLPASAPCSLTMGWDPWEPYMYLAPDNQVSGLDIELVKTLAASAQCELNFVQDDWVNLLIRLRDGKIDLVAGASITESREGFALFSAPYREEIFALYVRNNQEKRIPQTFSDIIEQGFTVGITTDYYYGDEVNRWLDDPQYASQFKATAYSQEHYFNLLSGDIDVLLEDPFVASYNIRRKGLDKRISRLTEKIHYGEVHLMFNLKTVDHTVVTRFNNALASIKRDGTYERILKRYLSNSPNAVEKAKD